MRKLLKALFICLTVCMLALSVIACNSGDLSSKEPGAHYGTKDDVKTLKYYVAEEGVDTFTLADDVDEIKSGAFKGNESLKKIVISSSDVKIGAGAFAEMVNLEEIVLPFAGEKAVAYNNAKNFGYIFGTEEYDEGVMITQKYNAQAEGEATYYIPQSLKKVSIIPSEDYSLSDYAFNGANVLTEVVLGDKVNKIGDYAFSNCYGIRKLEIPASVTEIGDYAFVGCNGLNGTAGVSEEDCLVFKGTSLAKIGDYAFAGTRLSQITLPEGVTELGEFVFASLTDGLTVTSKSMVKKVVLPASLKVVSNYAFFKATDLEEVIIGRSLEEIRIGAFMGCTSLKVVALTEGGVEGVIWLPNTLQKVYAHAFAELGENSLAVSLGSENTVFDATWNLNSVNVVIPA